MKVMIPQIPDPARNDLGVFLRIAVRILIFVTVYIPAVIICSCGFRLFLRFGLDKPCKFSI